MSVQEYLPEPNNPLGIDGIEFIEYATARPLVFGALLEQMGFVATARHRSREVTLYRQGSMNIIVNADLAYRHAIDMGAWSIQTRAGVMELNIPGVHGAGDSILYFVDRVRDFSIYDVDFKPIPGVPQYPPAIAGMHFFGVVQAIGRDRSPEWIDFYQQLMDFRPLPEGHFFGVLPKGLLLESPCHSFYLQLIEPPEGAAGLQWDEQLIRIGIGAPDVLQAVNELKQRGIVFVDRAGAPSSEKGALTQLYKGGISFELVISRPEHTA